MAYPSFLPNPYEEKCRKYDVLKSIVRDDARNGDPGILKLNADERKQWLREEEIENFVDGIMYNNDLQKSDNCDFVNTDKKKLAKRMKEAGFSGKDIEYGIQYVKAQERRARVSAFADIGPVDSDGYPVGW